MLLYKITHTKIGDNMSNNKKYNCFILFATFSRNIIEILSCVLLYKMNYSIKDILLFFSILYFLGIFISYFAIYLIKYIPPKVILFLSSLIFSFSYYYLSVMDNSITNLIIFSILLSLGSYLFHPIRHYYALMSLSIKRKKEIGNILIVSYMAIILSSYIGAYLTSTFGLVYVVIIIVILSIISILFLFNIKLNDKKIEYFKLEKNKLFFFIFEQFKVIFLTLQPLYLYLYVDNDIKYIGIINVIIGIASIIFTYFYVRKKNIYKSFRILNILFCFILVLKINIINKYILLIIAFFEGLGIKMYEVISSNNIYNIDNINKRGYIIEVELIFCLARSLICFIFFIFFNDIKIMLYISIFGIFISGLIKLYNNN